MTLSLNDRRALVLYGSETGNAQDLAEEAGRLVQRLRFSCQVLPLDEVKPDTLNTFSVVLITISTTGQGDIPANAKKFWKQLLLRRLPANHLAKTTFSLFGLGDSSYPQYNWAALKVNKRLLQLGAQQLSPRAEGDEQHPEGYDAAFVPWLVTLRSRILEEFPLPGTSQVIPDDVLLQPPWLLTRKVDHETTKNQSYGNKDGSNLSERTSIDRSFRVSVESNTRLTPQEHFQDVRHLVLSTEHEIPYGPGDVITIYPKNHEEDVEQLLSIMGWDSVSNEPVEFGVNPEFAIPHRPGKPSISSPHCRTENLTFRELVASNLDINAIPRRSFFSLIAHFTDDEFQKERLLEFANPDLIDELFDYTTRPRRSILEVLQEFDTLKIPWQWAAAILPQLRGRQFSLASAGCLRQPTHSSAKSDVKSLPGTNFELLVAIVKYKTVIRKIRRGVCTRYLEGLSPGSQLPVTFQKGTLAVAPSDISRPVVMIGPGTGLAPMRALIWERWTQQRLLQSRPAGEVTPKIAQSVLVFGCRSRKADYFFKEEWRELQDLGMPLKVFVAFSRDQDRKIYVQDMVSEQHELIYDLIEEQDGLVYVCGSSGKMPQAVRGALVDVMQKRASWSLDLAEEKVKSLEKGGRYKQETW